MTPRFDVTTLGETMYRLSVPVGQHLEAMDALTVTVGGAESNVCAALASLDRRCAWVSRLPNTPLGRGMVRRLRAANIDTQGVVFSDEGRVGTYYAEFATLPRGTVVYYDRKHSAMSEVRPKDIDWDYLLDTRLLHLTGITPALSDNCREVVHEAMRRANEAGVAISFDVNYRAKLWSPAEASCCLRDLLPRVTLLICGENDAQALFKFKGSAEEVLEKLTSLTGATTLVLTRGDKGATVLHDNSIYTVRATEAEVIDRFGAGDAFAAGVIDGVLDDRLEEGLRRGAVLGALALAQCGDMLITTRAELEQLLERKVYRIHR